MKTVSVECLEPNPWNPNVMDPETFEALKADVIAGDYDPLVATPKNIFYGDADLPEDHYIIVDGKHKWTAAVEADVGYVDVDVIQMVESEAKVYCYKRSKVRGSVDPVKEGELFNLDVEELGSEEAVAERYGVSRSYVAGRRSLVKLPETVKKLHRDPEKGLESLKREELAASIAESSAEEEYTEEEVEELVEASLQAEEIVPRGTLTTSHMEAIIGLSEEDQKRVAAQVVEEDLTVRETEGAVRRIKERNARRVLFEKALERAVQTTCPDCGAPPEDFKKVYTFGDEEEYDGDMFQCSKTSWHYWDYMKKAPSKEKQKAKEKKARSEALSRARLNPSYIRRAETSSEIKAAVRPWVLRKVKELEDVERVQITGTREGKTVRIEFPPSYGSALYVSISEPGMNHTTFGFDVEDKTYKSLPFKTKLDITGKASPEHRAEVHHFLDHVIKTDADPFLPEDEDARLEILRAYDEAPEEDENDG